MKDMKAVKFTYKLLLLLLGLLLVQSMLPAHLVLAQGGGPAPRPPINGGGSSSGGSGGSGSGSDAPAAAPTSGISGYVYDYTSGTNQAGVPVVAESNGRQLETVTDSNGYYQLGFLDLGKATLNLRLPPDGPEQVTPNWPVVVTDEGGQQVNLGFYWYDSESIPVRLIADLNGDKLQVRIEEQYCGNGYRQPD
jgi:hypothetical protein